MGVYIRNMVMPKNCSECEYGESNSKTFTWCLLRGVGTDGLEHIPNDCPMTYVPTPHGRLIDSHELVRKLHEDHRESFSKHEVWLMFSQYSSSTVIEAEE